MKKITRIGIWSLAKLQGVLMALFGLFAGILYSFGGLAIDTFVTLGWLSGAAFGTPGLSAGTSLAFGALIGMPFLFGVYGFVLGIVSAILVNFSLKLIGGLNIAIEE